MKEVAGGHEKFSWQIGYGAFSVSSSKLKVVIKYIERQKEHHNRKSYHEEVKEFMTQYDMIDYDENFFWT